MCDSRQIQCYQKCVIRDKFNTKKVKKQCETPRNSVKHQETVWNSHRHRHFWFPAVVKNIWHFFTPPFITFSTRIFTPVGKSLHQQRLYRLYLFASLIMATNGCFGHSGQSKVSETGLKWLPIHKNSGIDTKIKSVSLSKAKLWFWPFLESSKMGKPRKNL